MLTCSGCGAELPDSAVARQIGAARCLACGALNDLQRPSAMVRKELTPAPQRWVVEEQPGSLNISWRWFTPASLMLIPFMCFWNGIMATFAIGATEGGRHPERLLLGLLVPHVWVGLGLIWACIANLLNSTTIKAGSGKLEVRHGPMWWWGNKRLDSGDVTQLFVVERDTRRTLRYELCAVMRDGRKQVVLRTLTKADEARFLERALEKALRIADQPVAGELKRG